MNTVIKLLSRITLIFYALFCAMVISRAPLNEYEWMLDKSNSREEGLTFCNLPIDDNQSLNALLPFLFLAPLLVVRFYLSIRQRKLHLSLGSGAVLLAYWAFRFFLLLPVLCPGRSDF